MADKEKAIQEYSLCIALRPEIALSYFKRASVYMLQEEYALAEADFEKASQKGSPWNWARYNRAIALQRLEVLKQRGRDNQSYRQRSSKCQLV